MAKIIYTPPSSRWSAQSADQVSALTPACEANANAMMVGALVQTGLEAIEKRHAQMSMMEQGEFILTDQRRVVRGGVINAGLKACRLECKLAGSDLARCAHADYARVAAAPPQADACGRLQAPQRNAAPVGVAVI
eukprot:1881599-Pleurochrysis_carterae.AAC.1